MIWTIGITYLMIGFLGCLLDRIRLGRAYPLYCWLVAIALWPVLVVIFLLNIKI